MHCPLCGHTVIDGQKFCPECGESLKGVTDPTQVVPVTAPTADGVVPLVTATPDELPSISEFPTREIRPRDEIPDPEWATKTGETSTVAPGSPFPDPTPADALRPGLFDDLETPTPAHASPAIDASATSQLDEFGGPIEDWPQADATTTLGTVDGPSGVGSTNEIPEVFDGVGDLRDYPKGRDPFKVKLVFILAFFGAIATLMTAAADVIDIRTSVPVDGIATGIRTIDTLGTNLAVAGFFGATVMTLGGLFACFGFRWGAGLAGGAGLALVGWAGLVIGLAELRVASAESITRQTTDIAFTLKITRDLGFWLVVSVAVIGVFVFLASLRSFGMGGQPALNPWIAALGAVTGVVLVAGPLLPEGNATFTNNFRSPGGIIDLPTAYFGGRLAQLALIAFAVVFGLLIVRAYGLGLAAGGISVGLWLWITSLADVGNFPLGIAAGNFGSNNRTPHAVTSVGMVLTILMLVVAAALAIANHQRHRHRNY